MEGVGNLSFETTFNSPKLEIVFDGVGNLKAPDLNCEHIIRAYNH